MRPTSKMTSRLSFDMAILSHDRRAVRSQPEALLAPPFRQLDVAGILSARARPVNGGRISLAFQPFMREVFVAESEDGLFPVPLRARARIIPMTHWKPTDVTACKDT